MLNIAEDMAFAVGPMPAEALLLRARKDLTVPYRVTGALL